MFDLSSFKWYNGSMKNIDHKLDIVYNFTVNFIDKNGFPPSIREICEKCNIKSTASAYFYIEKLKERGRLVQSPLKKRTLSVPSLKNDTKNTPLIGVITAGTPIFAVENLEGYVPLSPDFNGVSADFALRVDGESMIDAGIYDKDIIIVQKQDTAENGEIVVALIDDCATVKRFYKRDGKYILHPENSTMTDMVFDNLCILGIVKGLIRKF